MQKILFLFLMLAAAPVWALPGQCTLTWDPPTTYTDGTPLGQPVTQYNLYMSQQSGNYPNPPLATVATPPVEVPCQGKRYWVVTAIVEGIESAYSNELLTKQTNAPTNLKVQ